MVGDIRKVFIYFNVRLEHIPDFEIKLIKKGYILTNVIPR